MKSYDKPTTEQVTAAIPLLSSPQHEAYFFARLDNPHWIARLAEHDVFKYPPQTERVEGGGVRFPTWAASQYLARMAAYAPSEVVDIFAGLKTDNASVIGDMLDAALRMPPQLATKLVPQIRQAAQDATLWMHFNDASDLCVRLADGGEMQSALAIADELFTPTFQQGQEEPCLRDDHGYKRGLKNVLPVFAVTEPRMFLRKLCNWLQATVKAKRVVDVKTGYDNSCWWRPAIEEHEQNSKYDFAGALVGFVREGFERAVHGERLSLGDALVIVERYPFLVFRRLRLHLINEFADKLPDVARDAILDRKVFDDNHFRHEYAMLVGRRLNLLTPEQQTTWFRWIDDGPDVSDFDDSIIANLERLATDEDRQRRIQYWQFEKLHCVRDHLDITRRDFYERMLAEHGEPRLADLTVHMRFGWGSQSPITLEVLSEMTFKEAIDAVSSWKPEGHGFMAPDVKGLASAFEGYVATKPEEFSSQSAVLEGRPAIYVRAFIQQMRKTIAAGGDVDLLAVLGLSKWVVDRPIKERTTPRGGRDALVDSDWEWTRNEISRLIEIVCRATVAEAPKYGLVDYRETIWHLLESLSRDREKSYIVHDLSLDDPRLHDYVDLSINSPRGKAVEAALDYANWVANHIKKRDGQQEAVPGGFDAMPEIREMIEWQLAPENRTVAALSVIGMRIGVLSWIDKQWLAQNADRLFNLVGIEQSPPASHGWAAWNAFLVWVAPHGEFYQLFQSQFAYAVEQAANVQPTEKTRSQPMNRLGEHLIVLYARGQLALNDDKGLLRRFLATSNPDIRRHAIGSVGQMLAGTVKAPDDVVNRLRELWGVYWSGAGKKDAGERPDCLLFGTWFSSGNLPEQWALEQLEQFVQVAPILEPDDAVVEQLAKISQSNPASSVRILDRMVRGDTEGWRIQGWSDSASTILETAIRANGEARTTAIKTIDFLGRRGYMQFGNLLK